MVAMTSATVMMTSDFSPQLLDNRAVIRVAGDGALAFLHNLLTMDLTAHTPAYAALLTPQGKILHDVFVVPDGDVVWIDAAKSQSADLLKRLMMYRLRAKLDIAVDATKAVAVSSQNNLPGLCYVDPRLAAMGHRAIVDAGHLSAGENYNLARLSLGLADSNADIGSGEMFVHEANLDQLHGVSFTKGCYVGQEVVSRTHHRNMARKRILPVRFASPVANATEITSGEQMIGTVFSTNSNQGLALIRLDRLAEVTNPLQADGVSVIVQKPVWAKFELTIPGVAQ
jgi:tRNA-modifying protein YgfZ